ncbi:MAG: nicotinate-nucleotide diphosphorylase (carboxylating), partial [Alphaproteobacteria bacterium]|nr:nicotinate-nucleotide diphosphorylase (carboxylating) [Alphaproteobacteria bacterium]
MLPAGFDLSAFVKATLEEDVGSGDVTSTAVVPVDMRFSAHMRAREVMVVAGLGVAAAFFNALDPDAQIEILADEGAPVAVGATLMTINGKARALLTAERAALNTVQHLSGIA